jgi:arylsulfatase A-like enzyme
MRNRLYCLALGLLVACSKPHSTSDGSLGETGQVTTTHPNIVFILTDDLNVEVYGHMPRLTQLLDNQGTSFHNHFLNISLCCPSRTAILRGQYAHNTTIFSNAPPTGGFEVFFANGEESDALPVWISSAGYRTGLIGKYLNGYPNTAPKDYIPPGWTEWYSPVAGNPYSEYNYTLNENGTEHSYGHTPADYFVDVISAKSADFIQRAAAAHVPFFLYVAPYVPHSPATPPDRYLNDFPNAMAPRTPSFNEADVSDKPAWLASKPLLTQMQIDAIDMLYRKRLRTMEAVQDLVQNVVDTLTQTGQLANTYIVFTSDNGFHQGQHRLDSGKNTEFDEDLFVPLIVRGPGVPAGGSVDLATVNVDFAPTFVELAGLPARATIDGRSLVPLLHGPPLPISVWRQMVLLEHGSEVGSDEPAARQVDPGTLEPPDTEVLAPASMPEPSFEGLRTSHWTYVELTSGEKELYDHVRDPDQLTNIASTAAGNVMAQLAALLHNMHGCQGQACRTAESMTPPP